MYTKQYTKPDGTKVTERYQSWSETMFEQAWVGLSHTFVGMLAIMSLSITAIYKKFKPTMLGYEWMNVRRRTSHSKR